MPAIKATFAEWRMVKGRKVLQLVMEVPLEKQQEVSDVLGFPMPDRDLWVGIARITEEAATAPRGGKLAQRAGILCNEGGFQRFMDTTNAEDAAEALRQHCGVTSRAHIDNSDGAARKFLDRVGEYELWLRDAA